MSDETSASRILQGLVVAVLFYVILSVALPSFAVGVTDPILSAVILMMPILSAILSFLTYLILTIKSN